MPKAIMSLFTFCFLSANAFALPPEGLEAYSLIGDGGRSGKSVLYLNIGYVNPSWLSDYETFQAYTSVNTGGNYLSFGGSVTTGNKFADRDAYFLRYDITFYGQTVSAKLTHIDLRYAQSGKNILSLDYNASFGAGSKFRFYSTIGLYYRFTLNRGNQPTWNPVNFNTEDKEYYPEICFGGKLGIGNSGYITADINTRDPFNSYNGDNMALDVALNLMSKSQFTWRLTSSTRFTGLIVGTGDIGEQSVLFGIVAPY